MLKQGPVTRYVSVAGPYCASVKFGCAKGCPMVPLCDWLFALLGCWHTLMNLTIFNSNCER